MPDKQNPPLVSFLSGAIAGGVEAAATYPFEFAKTRAQLHSAAAGEGARPRNPFLAVRAIVREEGARALYKGCSTLVVGSVAKDGVRFLAFDAIRDAFRDPATGTLTPARSIAAGVAAGVVASALAVTPSERLKTALIDDARGPGARRFAGPVSAATAIVREQGVRGMYAGFVGTTLKQASATGFRLGTYNILKEAEAARGVPQGTLMNFANGCVAGIITTYGTQPFDTIKTRSQTARGASTLDAARSILADGGVRAFWRGTVMRLGRTVFSGGILFTVYEEASRVLNPLLAPASK
jgi:solute carrier family 25 citrate transporter 1